MYHASQKLQYYVAHVVQVIPEEDLDTLYDDDDNDLDAMYDDDDENDDGGGGGAADASVASAATAAAQVSKSDDRTFRGEVCDTAGVQGSNNIFFSSFGQQVIVMRCRYNLPTALLQPFTTFRSNISMRSIL